MNTVELIKKKRAGEELSGDEIRYLIGAYTKNEIPDYQMAALMMAIFFQGMKKDESAALTEAMLNSGTTLDLASIPAYKVGKHSTGGVGDKTTMIITPIAAAAGIIVPQTTGRGLGHTGGTVDKLESIPGYRTELSSTEFKRILEEAGCSIVGQSGDIAPADKKMYALRDVTGTIESIPLITGSIMSKKLAEGIDGVVFDVKTGSGAFMKTLAQAEELADTLTAVSHAFKKDVVTFITDMNSPLGSNVGNWLEIEECLRILQDPGTDNLSQLSILLSGAMIFLAGKAESLEDGNRKAEALLHSGEAFEKFIRMAAMHGAETRYLEKPGEMKQAAVRHEFVSETEGYIAATDCYEIGMAALELGAGRKTKEDAIDPLAGIVMLKQAGDAIDKGEPLAALHTSRQSAVDDALARMRKAVVIEEQPPEEEPLVKKTIIKKL